MASLAFSQFCLASGGCFPWRLSGMMTHLQIPTLNKLLPIYTKTLRTGSNVSLLCLNFPLLTPSQIAPKFYFLVELCRAKIQSQVEAGHGWEGFHAKIWLRQCEQNELSHKMCILFYEMEELLERHVTSLFSLSARSGVVSRVWKKWRENQKHFPCDGLTRHWLQSARHYFISLSSRGISTSTSVRVQAMRKEDGKLVGYIYTFFFVLGSRPIPGYIWLQASHIIHEV